MKWHVTAAGSGDPYIEWAQGTAWRRFAAAKTANSLVPVLLELRPDGPDAAQLAATGWVHVPGHYLSGGPWRHVTAWAKRARLDELAAMVLRLEMSLPAAAGKPDSEAPGQPLGGRRPVVAVIDRDCAFLNANFCQALSGPGRAKTRLLAVWDQGHVPKQTGWQRPAGFGYGREITREGIDAQLVGVDDEDAEAARYAKLGVRFLDRDRPPEMTHGTFMLDAAGGLPAPSAGGAQAKPAQADTASKADLVFVALPGLAPGDATGAGAAAYMLDAFHYVLRRAGPNVPVVINLSIGAQAGAHDGTDILAQALDDLVKARPRLAITVAAGNGRHEHWNASGTVVPGQRVDAALAWRTLPSDTTDSFAEFWFDPPAAGAPEPLLQVQTPDGLDSAEIGPGQAAELRRADGPLLARLAYGAANPFSQQRRLALLALAPSDNPEASSPAGRWTVRVRHPGAAPVRLDAWVQRDEPPGGVGTNRQSYFEQVYPDPDAPPPADGSAPRSHLVLDGGSTLSDTASSAGVLVVGSCSRVNAEVSTYSADGGAHGRAVDLLVAADETPSTLGLLGSGTLSGSRVRLAGTSVAAPVAARALLDWLQNQKALPGPARDAFLDTLPAPADGAFRTAPGVRRL